MGLQVMVIVEGQGDEQSIRILLERIWRELLGGGFIDVLRPWRQPQGSLRKEEELKNEIDRATIKLKHKPANGSKKLVLLMIDSEGECPKKLAPKLLQWAREARADTDIACVLPNPMFETWFAAAASSLAGVNGFPQDIAPPDDPEENKIGKAWVKKQLKRKYREKIDQPRFTAKFNLELCRRNSRSFDKLCRELEKRLPASDDNSGQLAE